MNPLRPTSGTNLDPRLIATPDDTSGPARQGASGAIQSGAASQKALVDIYRKLDSVRDDFETFIDAGQQMMDELAAVVTSKTVTGHVKAFDVSFATVKKSSQNATTNFEALSIRLSRQKKDAQNVVAIGNCKAKLEEYRQFQNLMLDWKKIADGMADFKTAFVDLRLAVQRSKVIEGLPQHIAAQPPYVEQSRTLEGKIVECINRSCDAHRPLLGTVQIVLRKLDHGAASEGVAPTHYNWANEAQAQMCLELASATVAATCAAARSLHLHLEPANQRIIDAYYPIVTGSGPAHEQHVQIFEKLANAIRGKIAAYWLYDKTSETVNSSDALQKFWQKPTTSRHTESDIKRLQRHAIYRDFHQVSSTLIPLAKVDELFRLVISHQAHLEKLQTSGSESSDREWDIGGAARDIDLNAVVESYFAEMRLATSVIKSMILRGKFSEPELTSIKNRLGGLIASSAAHQSKRAELSHQQLVTIADEIRTKNVTDPADVTRLAQMNAYFARCFHGAAMAAYDKVPESEISDLQQNIKLARSYVAPLISISWQCAIKFVEQTVGHSRLDAEILNPESELSRAYAEVIKLTNEIASTFPVVMGSNEHILFEQMFSDLNQYETNLHSLKLQSHVLNPVQDIDRLLGQSIAHGMREVRRAHGLSRCWNAKLDAMKKAKSEGNPITEPRMRNAAEFAERYRLRAKRLQHRVDHSQILTMLQNHPALLQYYEMVRNRYLRFHSELKRLKEQHRAAETAISADPDIDSVSDSDLRLLDDLSQFEFDIQHFIYKFKKKFDVSGANRSAGFDTAFACLQRIQADVRHYLNEATDLIGIDPSEERQDVKADRASTEAMEIEPHAVEETPDSKAHQTDIEKLSASVDMAGLSPPSPARLQMMKTEMAQRDQQIADSLAGASGWVDFGRELADDVCNPAYAQKFFNRAAECQDQAAALLDINEQLSNSFFSTPASKLRDKGKNAKNTAAQIRSLAENTRLEGDRVYTHLTKSRDLPYDRDVSFVLANKEIEKIKVSEKRSYTPKNAATGLPRVEHKNQELVRWMKEIIITLKPGESGPYPEWVVHLHYPHADTEHFTISHAKRYEDRMKGSSSGKIARQYIGRDNVKRLLHWAPTA